MEFLLVLRFLFVLTEESDDEFFFQSEEEEDFEGNAELYDDESKNQLTSQWKETCEKNEALEKRIKCFKSENADLENNLDVASWEIENLRDSSQKLIKDMEKLINRGNWYFSIFIGTQKYSRLR